WCRKPTGEGLYATRSGENVFALCRSSDRSTLHESALDSAHWRSDVEKFGATNSLQSWMAFVDHCTQITMKKILVTGGAGFIGSHLVEWLLSTGEYKVTIVDNFNEFYNPAIKRRNVAPFLEQRNFELFEGDIVDIRGMNELCASLRFDCIVHLAGRAGVR